METRQPVPIALQMLQSGFDFIAKHEDILDKEKYKFEHNISILDEDNLLGKWQARVIYTDGSKQTINLFEENK